MPRLSHLDRNCALLAVVSLSLSGCTSISQTTPRDIARELVREAVQTVIHGEGGIVLTVGAVDIHIG